MGGGPLHRTGARARTVVPRVECDSMSRSPPTRLRRSFMLVRPSPGPRFVASTSNPTPSITNGEFEGWAVSVQMHIEMPAAAVSHRVVQGFLENPVETERHVRRDGRRNVFAVEIDLGAVLRRELFTEATHGRHQAHFQQPWRVQLV